MAKHGGLVEDQRVEGGRGGVDRGLTPCGPNEEQTESPNKNVASVFEHGSQRVTGKDRDGIDTRQHLEARDLLKFALCASCFGPGSSASENSQEPQFFHDSVLNDSVFPHGAASLVSPG
jgi:hypothetical protein